MDQDELGAQLRAAREAKGLSLRGLAATIEVSPSLLSQIENGKTKPSVDTLYALVRQLEISIDAVLGRPAAGPGEPAAFAPESTFVLQTAAETPVLEMQNGVRWERLAVLPGLDIEALRVTYQPGASSSVEGQLMRHLGYEHLTIVSGELTLQLEFDEHVVRAGDSMAFDSQRPHLFLNRGTEPAIGIWYIVGRLAQKGQTSTANSTSTAVQTETLGSAIDVLRSFRQP